LELFHPLYYMLDFACMAKKGLGVVVPVYNEEVDLARNIPPLHSFLQNKMGDFDWEIVIADNASTDKTPIVVGDLLKLGRVKYVRLEPKGRGRALKKVWLGSGKEYLAYMDIDLSGDISFFPRLIEKLEEGNDIAIGSRLARGAKVINRPRVREIMSRGYSLLFRTVFGIKFYDAQCGFKAIKKSAALKILPAVLDTGWFFDTELLVIAQKSGYKIAEVPIVWKDDPSSTVKVAKTAWGDLRGIWRIFWSKPWQRLI